MKWLGRVGLVAAVLAATAGGWWVWARFGTDAVTGQTTAWAGVVGAASLVVAVGTSTAQGVAGYRRRLAERPDVAGLVKFAPQGCLPFVGEVDVTALGAKLPIGTGQTPFVARDVDEAVNNLIAAGGMVVLTGPAAAGKSRLAAEAIHRAGVARKRLLLVPVKAGSLRALKGTGHAFTDTIVVLDDLEHFLADGGLDTTLLAAICASPSTVVVATIRAGVLAELEEAFNADLADRTALASYRPGVELLGALRREGRIITIASALTEAEKNRAETVRTRQGDERIAEAVASDAGFGEHLIAGPAQMDRWTNDTGDVLEAVGRAVISAAVDARRAGFNDALPAHILDLLTPAYLPPRLQGRATPAPAAGRAWAARIITGTTASSCITHGEDDTYTAADYLTDRADQPQSPLHDQAVPDTTWTILQTHATPHQALGIGAAAYIRNRPDIAITAFTHTAGHGLTGAMVVLGVLLEERGDTTGAETWYRRAADNGDTGAMFNLGNLLRERGDTTGAETWYRRAADNGDTGAMVNLGNLLRERGDIGEAETWWRAAADEGDTDAMFSLGVLFYKRGDIGEAETWWRAARDHTGAMFNLGNLLYERGDIGEAETWWRAAADNGDTSAMNNLAELLEDHVEDRGETSGEAEMWRARAVETD